MTADTLRRAAALMRERAEATQPSPWWPYERFTYTGIWSAPAADAAGRQVGTGRTTPDAEHIASWHPAVAIAVADWLEWSASRSESGNDIPAMRGQGFEQALAVARAYLGEES